MGNIVKLRIKIFLLTSLVFLLLVNSTIVSAYDSRPNIRREPTHLTSSSPQGNPHLQQEDQWLKYLDYHNWTITVKESQKKRDSIMNSQKYQSGYVMVNYSRLGIGWQYNPVTTIQLLLAEYQLGNYTRVMEIANFLRGNLTDQGELLYNFAIKEWNYHVAIPWVSAMAQGLAIQAFLRAYDLSHNSTYMDAANLVVKSFTTPYRDGGFVYHMGINQTWLLEVPNRPVDNLELILNGHLFSIFGLWEYHAYPTTNMTLKTNIVEPLIKSSVNATLNNIHKFYQDFSLSSYSDTGHIHFNYLLVHVYQMELAYRLNLSSSFYKIYKDWKSSYFTNSKYSPDIVDFSSTVIAAGILLQWNSSRPVKVKVETGPAGAEKPVYVNRTLSSSGKYLIKAPNHQSREYFRIWFADADNYTCLYPKSFNKDYSAVWTQKSTNPQYDADVSSDIMITVDNQGLLFRWNTDYPVRSELEIGTSGNQMTVYRSSSFDTSGSYLYKSVRDGNRYYYRFTFETKNSSYAIIPQIYSTAYSVIFKTDENHTISQSQGDSGPSKRILTSPMVFLWLFPIILAYRRKIKLTTSI